MQLPPWLRNGLGDRLSDRAAVGMEKFEPSSGEIVAERCEQLRKLRDEHGKLAEPLWYAGLGVSAHCEEGDRLGHEWSNGYQRRSREMKSGSIAPESLGQPRAPNFMALIGSRVRVALTGRTLPLQFS